MKKVLSIFLFFLIAVNSSGQSSSMREQFANPGFEYGPWVFWMWMNGNVSKAGITLDLEAMQKTGICGAVLFSSDAGIPNGKIQYGSREWMDMNKFMFSEAKRLGMKVMLHNAPGYSVTGGPWITPENSMQQVVWTETYIAGNNSLQPIKLPKPYAKMGYYEDAVIIAYPSLKGEGENTPKQFVNPNEWLFEYEKPFEASSVVIRREHTGPPHHPYDGPRDNPPTLTLEYSSDGKSFEPLSIIRMPELRELNVPTSKNFNPVKAKYYRIRSDKETKLTEVSLYTAPRLLDWEYKANYSVKGNRITDLSVKNMPEGTVVNPSEVIDLTKQTDPDGTLHWVIPAGKWTILRIGHTTTGEENAAAPFGAKGLECDKLGKRGIQAHYNGFLKNLFAEMKEYRGNSFYGITIDSWKAGSQNWTKGFESEFYRRNQYSLVPYMAAFTGRIVGGTSSTEKFLEDVRKTQATMLAENFHQELQSYCRQNGLLFLNESYGDGPFNSLEVSKYVDIPAGEFWAHSLYGGSHTNNQAGYIARTSGKKIAAAEAFTAMPDLSKFTEYPAAMKGEGDWMFCNGINRFMFHTFAHQPHPTAKPGMTMGPFGTHFNRNQTWWKQSKSYMDYLRRCQFLLQQGEFVSNSSPWIPAGDTIDSTQKKDDFSFYSLNKNVIINYIHRKADSIDYYFVANNKRNPEKILATFDIAGKQPEIWYPETGRQIPVYKYKTEAGKTIISLNLNSAESVFIVFANKPTQQSVWDEKDDLRKIKIKRQSFADIHDTFTTSVRLRPDVAAMNGRSYVLYPQSGEKLYGKGHATIGLSAGQNGIKVFEQSGDKAEQVLFAETKIEGWSLVNVLYEAGKPTIYLNGKKIKEGKKSKYIVHGNDNELAPKEAMITLFQGEYDSPQIQSKQLSEHAAQINKPCYLDNEELSVTNRFAFNNPWEISFPGKNKIQIPGKKLKSLHLYADEEVKYFSGTATYTTHINIPKKPEKEKFILDLGNVAFFAEIFINENEISTLWKAPYICDITDNVVPGENRIEIKVTNLWTNRLIGDEFLPVENQYDQWGELDKFPDWYVNNEPYKGQRNTFVSWKQYEKDAPLTESGLIGQVRIITVKE